MSGGREPFSRLNSEELDGLAQRHGFKRRGERNWIRRTDDFVQLINLQRSQWSPDHRYLNFALWARALGEPPTFAHSKFHFLTRAENVGATDLISFFSAVERLTTLADLPDAFDSGRVVGLTNWELRELMT